MRSINQQVMVKGKLSQLGGTGEGLDQQVGTLNTDLSGWMSLKIKISWWYRFTSNHRSWNNKHYSFPNSFESCAIIEKLLIFPSQAFWLFVFWTTFDYYEFWIDLNNLWWCYKLIWNYNKQSDQLMNRHAWLWIINCPTVDCLRNTREILTFAYDIPFLCYN